MKKYLDDLAILFSHGYNPIKVTTMYLETTFVFKTKEEAEKAYQELEIEKKLLQAWWYGEDFDQAVKDYEDLMSEILEIEYKIKIYNI